MKEIARHLLALEAGGTIGTTEAGTAAATRIYEKLALHLGPVVGEAGFQALFARTLKLSKPAFACLKEVETQGRQDVAVLGPLCECLKAQTPASVRDIVTALLATFISLLSTFIGEGLAWKLLRNAWPEVLPSEPPQREKQS